MSAASEPTNPANPIAAYCWSTALGIAATTAWVTYACITRSDAAVFAPLLIGAVVGLAMLRMRGRLTIVHPVAAILITAALVLVGHFAINQLVPYFEARDVFGHELQGEFGRLVLEEVRKDLASERTFMDLFDLVWLVGGCVLAGAITVWPGER